MELFEHLIFVSAGLLAIYIRSIFFIINVFMLKKTLCNTCQAIFRIRHFCCCHKLYVHYEILLSLSILFTREISDSLGQPVNCISMSNDGNCVLAGCLDSTVRLLDRYVGNISGTFTTNPYPW